MGEIIPALEQRIRGMSPNETIQIIARANKKVAYNTLLDYVKRQADSYQPHPSFSMVTAVMKKVDVVRLVTQDFVDFVNYDPPVEKPNYH